MHQSRWIARLATSVVEGGRRPIGLAFGKAIAFTYAVIVSVVANIVFELVHQPHQSYPGTAAVKADVAVTLSEAPAGGAEVRAPLPSSRSLTAVSAAQFISQAPVQPENPRPGPGSGGLY